MPIRVVPHGDEKKDLMEAFNARMREAGSPWGFYVDPTPPWVPLKKEGQPVHREFHLALEVPKGTPKETDPVQVGEVVGAYALKPQRWWVRGEDLTVADWQGPVSLGVIDNRYAALGIRLVRDMLKRQPHLYSWGHGGHDEPMITMLRKLGWMMHDTPFLFRVCRPKNFLQKNAFLRQDPRRAFAQDVLAISGVGTIGLHALHQALRLRSGQRFDGAADVVDGFDGWANGVWESCKTLYEALAYRDEESLALLVPAEHRTQEWPPPVRLRVRSGGRIVGWAVVVERQLDRDPRFGDMRMGMIADAFGSPNDAGPILQAAYDHLRSRGVDMVFANQSHPAWIRAYQANGFVAVERRRTFCASPALEKALQPWDRIKDGLLLTNMDGHGPIL